MPELLMRLLFRLVLPCRGSTNFRGRIEYRLYRRLARYQRFYQREVWGRE